MHRPPSRGSLPPAQLVAEKVFNALERFLHIEAVSGVVLLLAAVSALWWANSPAAASYDHFWHAPLAFSFGELVVSQPLHFWINDGLMTIFFLVVGLEIRREIYEGALANLRLAALPLAAAIGGIAVPALIYSALNMDPITRQGWAIPTATDIAFAVGVLALLGKSIPSSVRILLLALAIIDDIAAVLIIAFFYSSGLNLGGVFIVMFGVLLVLAFQRIGISWAYAYILPGVIIWSGMLHIGIHPTLTGVVLGLMTPVVPAIRRDRPIEAVKNALNDFGERVTAAEAESDARNLLEPVKQLQRAQRELLPPVIRVQAALHPWVAFAIMPLFALANAGVTIEGFDSEAGAANAAMMGVLLGLVLGKPIGIVLASWTAVRVGWCQLPADLSWRGVWLVGCLGGIGFTMSIFIATLAFHDNDLLSAAKLGVLTASAIAGIAGLIVGKLLVVTRHTSVPAEATR
jgi:NhaA family Na+:H+ antiporter